MTAFCHCKPKVIDGHKFSPMEVGGISLLQLGQHKTERSPRFARDDRLLGRLTQFARDDGFTGKAITDVCDDSLLSLQTQGG
jgi:hypothetical protein